MPDADVFPAAPLHTGRFDGKVALVTGAASGVGRAVALRLSAEGASVLAVDVHTERLAQTLELSQGCAGELRTHVTDLRRPEECAAAVQAAVDAYGRLDVVGNIAGILRVGHVTEVQEATYRESFAVNADAYFFVAQAAIPHLLQSRGNLINIASNAGIIGGALHVVYSMTKGAVVLLTKSLAMEFMKQGIRVNAIAPGAVDTNIMEGVAYPDDADWDLVMRYASTRPSSQPDHIATLFSFLASAEAAHVHGAIWPADDGLTAG